MNIALLSVSLPAAGKKGGSDYVFVDRLATALVDRGHEVCVLTFSDADTARAYDVRQIGPTWLAAGRLRRNYLATWLINFHGLRRDFDVLHLHGDDVFYFRRDVPTVRTFLGSAAFEAATATSWRRRLEQSLIFVLEQLAALRADAVYGIGPDSRAMYRADGILQCGVSAADVEAEKSPNPTVLFVGTWEGRKRGRFLRDLFVSEVIPQLPDAELLMVSDYAEESKGVRWLGSPDDDELRRLYASSWVLCHPSNYEGLGLPYIEALTYGLPVVSTPNPGASDVLGGGEFGVLAEDDEMGAALIELLGNASARSGIAERGYIRASKFGWTTLMRGYEDAYRLAIRRFNAKNPVHRA